MTIQITDESKGVRLDVLVTQEYEDISRAYAQYLIDIDRVLVNGKSSKPSYRVRSGDNIEVDYDPSETEILPAINIPVLYEDDQVVVINKPIGVLSHSKGAFNPESTVATWLADRLRAKSLKLEAEIGDRDGIVHRLDRATSGVMICAKTEKVQMYLQKQFSTRNVKKTYLAVVEGIPSEPEAMITWPIERNPKAPQTFRVGANGKSAETVYKVLHVSKDNKFALVELRPTTGRTHQLRVHMKHLGNPIHGDVLYGGQAADRLYLHAISLEITLPSKHRETFVSSVPKEFKAY